MMSLTGFFAASVPAA